jgi:hypothetical protein
VIEVEQLTKRYGSVKAIDSVSFRVEKGENSGLPRPQRRRQDHNDAHSHLLSSSHGRDGARRRLRRLQPARWKSSAGSVTCRRIRPSTTK